ncbi:hypothetical protein [Bradyrhizobium australafricanum]|uniref:hypothetical protein n=1 Tax=Bradyrhizobium australafricanum TaxID=2821406 RepID=UPI00289EBC05|nr:hypothetical protein [Bradyrhizobium australafricanum]
MKRIVLITLALVWFATPGAGQTSSAAELNDRFIQSRAVEAVIWGMPAVNYDLMLQAALKIGGKENQIVYQIVYWSNLLDWKNQTLLIRTRSTSCPSST